MSKFLRFIQRKMGFEHWIILGFTLLGIGNLIHDRPGAQDGLILHLSGWYLLVGGLVILIDQWFHPKFAAKYKSLYIPIAWFLMTGGLLAAGIVTVVWYVYIPWTIGVALRAFWLSLWYRGLKRDDD